MTAADWFRDSGSDFPTERAAVAGCDLSVMRIGERFYWLARRDGRDVAEGVEATGDAARQAAESTARQRGPEPG